MMLDRDTDPAHRIGKRLIKWGHVGSKYNSIYDGLEQIELVEFESPLRPGQPVRLFRDAGLSSSITFLGGGRSAMIEIEKGFWRGDWPLLLALGATQLTQQADILMVSRRAAARQAPTSR